MSIDTAHFRRSSEMSASGSEDDRHHDIGNASLEEETGELFSPADNHLAGTATETYERELDEGLEEDAREQLSQVEKALARIERGEREPRGLRQGDSGRAPRGRALDDPVHRGREAPRPVNEPARRESLPSTSASGRRRTRSARSWRPSGRWAPGSASGSAWGRSSSRRSRPTSRRSRSSRGRWRSRKVQIAGPFSIHHVRNSWIPSASSPARLRS